MIFQETSHWVEIGMQVTVTFVIKSVLRHITAYTVVRFLKVWCQVEFCPNHDAVSMWLTAYVYWYWTCTNSHTSTCACAHKHMRARAHTHTHTHKLHTNILLFLENCTFIERCGYQVAFNYPQSWELLKNITKLFVQQYWAGTELWLSIYW
jgi:hypothetical protein